MCVPAFVFCDFPKCPCLAALPVVSHTLQVCYSLTLRVNALNVISRIKFLDHSLVVFATCITMPSPGWAQIRTARLLDLHDMEELLNEAQLERRELSKAIHQMSNKRQKTMAPVLEKLDEKTVKVEGEFGRAMDDIGHLIR